MHNPISRRHFLRTAAAGTLSAPFITSGLRAASPNGKVRHASFGTNGQAWSDLMSFKNSEHFELVAAADVDTRNFDRLKKEFPGVRCYQSWKELLEKEADKIDSVNVTTPDHMHAPIGMAAMALGKHLYGQKPLTQNLYECRQMMLRAREKNLMTQMGIQISSAFTERHAVALIQQGAIGKVKEVHSFSGKAWGDMGPMPEKKDTPPAGFDWDGWLGVAADRPYIDGWYHPGNWRKRRDFGTGTLGDMGCHMFSGWFRALALTNPLSVTSGGPAPSAHSWAVNGRVEYIFPGTQYTDGKTVKVTWHDGKFTIPPDIAAQVDNKVPDQGSIYIGEGGVLVAPHMSSPVLYPREKFKDNRLPKLEPRDHYKEFIQCVKDGKEKPSANFDYSAPMTEAVLLGCLASVFPGKTLEWDTAALSFKNSPEATALVKRSYRPGWEIS